MKFPFESFSKGQPKNVQCGGWRQLRVTGEERIVVWKCISKTDEETEFLRH